MKNIEYLIEIRKDTSNKFNYVFKFPNHWNFFFNEEVLVIGIDKNVDDKINLYSLKTINNSNLELSHNTIMNYVDNVVSMNKKIDEKTEEEIKLIAKIKDDILSNFGKLIDIDFIKQTEEKKPIQIENERKQLNQPKELVKQNQPEQIKNVNQQKEVFVKPADLIDNTYDDIEYNENIDIGEDILGKLNFMGDWNPQTNNPRLPNPKDSKYTAFNVITSFQGSLKNIGFKTNFVKENNIIYSDGLNWVILNE